MILSEGFGACEENVKALAYDREKLDECMSVHLHEAAKAAFAGFSPKDIFFGDAAQELYREALSRLIPDPLGADRELTFRFCGYIAEAALFPQNEGICRLFAEEEPASGKRISCLYGGSSDVAFDAFSAYLGKASVLYGENFTAVCENLYDSLCDYAVLPVENSRDGILGGIAALIDKYELYVTSMTRVEQDGAATSFALLTRTASLPLGSGDIHVIIETTGDSLQSGFVCCAAEHFGGVPEQIQSLRLQNDRFRTVCTLRFGGDLSGFLCSVMLNIPGAELKGMYKEIL